MLNDMFIRKSDLGPGDFVTLPDLYLVDGRRFTRPDAADDCALFLVFGSLTCPVTERAAPRLAAALSRLTGYFALRYGLRRTPIYLGIVYAVLGAVLSILLVRDTTSGSNPHRMLRRPHRSASARSSR
jgi:hypothetical protein